MATFSNSSIPSSSASSGSAVAGLDTSADLSETPSDDEVQTIAERIKRAKEQLVDPVDLQKFQDAEDQAKQLYQERASRAEWLSVADRIGQNLIRLNAANEGLKKNVDMSHVDLGPGNDWEKTIDRYGKDYSTDLEKANRDRAAALTNQQQQMGLGEKAFDLASREKSLQMQQKRAEAAQRETNDRQDKSIILQNQLAAQREAAQAKRQQEAEAARAEQLRKSSELKDADEDVKQGTKADLALKTLTNQLTADTDLGKKSKDDLEKQYGKLAAEAGVDLQGLQARLSDQETVLPSWLGGKSSADEATDKKKIIQTELEKSKNLLDAYKARKKELLGIRTGADQTQPATSAPAAAPGTVKVKGPSGTVAVMSKEAAEKYLQKPGYSQVP